jgi:hypothetical protein
MFRFVLSVVLALCLSSVTYAGGVAVSVPSCQNANVNVQAVQAVPVYANVQAVQVQSYAVQAVPVHVQQRVQVVRVQQQHVQQVQVVQVNRHRGVNVQVNSQPRTPFRNAVQAFRNEIRR